MVYIFDNTLILKSCKAEGVFIQISLILSVESVSNELLAIIKMKNIVKIVKLNLRK